MGLLDRIDGQKKTQANVTDAQPEEVVAILYILLKG